ncbi:uncharacterized protein EV420DRAFT_1694483 [Desarmillaria tabescens]|uniref:DUF6697 domain-containing protein n=1 Tax=Armillaria tabescens TaxID=1929756 RepID=A0AA39N2L8_ARMTA|nr:uncharacterized protein EV420DRAFT_1694483 [Desarmillaria tabescens]KAK0455193.1 hypothetical protein EV420DRAFT_1694483 [Desarmillaria tabescens]
MMAADGALANELAQVKRELEILKAADPFKVVEMAIEISTERMKVTEAMHARDAAVRRLSEAYISLRQKVAIIDRLQGNSHGPEFFKECMSLAQRDGGVTETDMLKEEISALESIVKSLREEMREQSAQTAASTEPPPRYDDGAYKTSEQSGNQNPGMIPLRILRDTPPLPSRCSSQTSMSSVCTENHIIRPILKADDNGFDYKIARPVPESVEAEETIEQRNKLLAAMPLPQDPPDDTLKPILLPQNLTLHEFLGSTSGSLRSSLSNYRLLQQLTTSWCPEREEHGYFLTPAFKCNTNPRVATAHRWSSVDVLSRMNKPTECFFNKDGTWYYAGIYKAFRLDDLTTKEWEALSNETVQAIIKETIAGRKNVSPQNVYETSQLYAAGALKVACIGLQCVGFNRTMYKSILEQASKCMQGGKWKVGHNVSGSTWNANGTVGEVTEALNDLGISGKVSEG